MLPTQRRQAILTELRQAKAVSAEELARKFSVSLETIRRDLRGLRDPAPGHDEVVSRGLTRPGG